MQYVPGVLQQCQFCALSVSSWDVGALLTIVERDGEDHADVYIYGPSGYQCKQAEVKAKSVTGMDVSVSSSGDAGLLSLTRNLWSSLFHCTAAPKSGAKGSAGLDF